MTIYIERALCVPRDRLINADTRKRVKKENKKRSFRYDFAADTVFVKKYAADSEKITLAACVDFVTGLQRNKARVKGGLFFFTPNLKFNREPHVLPGPADLSGSSSDNGGDRYSSVILYGAHEGISIYNEQLSTVRCKTVSAFVLSPDCLREFVSIGKRVLESPDPVAAAATASPLAQTLNDLAEATKASVYTPNEYTVGSELAVQDYIGVTEPYIPKSLARIEPEVVVDTESGTKGLQIDIPVIPKDQLPFVSLITPTFCNENMFFLSVLSFLNQNYPRDKIEWLIVDDTPDSYGKSVKEVIPREDDRIHHFQINTPKRIPLGKKLNIGISKARGDYIVHFFDSVYYPADSILYRVSTLLQEIANKSNKLVVGTSTVGCYHIVRKDSFTYREHDKDGNFTILQEPSLAYHKNVWNFRHFSELVVEDNHKNVLGLIWLKNMTHFLLDLPYQPVCTRILTDIDATKQNMAKFGGTLEHSISGSESSLYSSFPIQIKEGLNLIYQGVMRNQSRIN